MTERIYVVDGMETKVLKIEECRCLKVRKNFWFHNEVGTQEYVTKQACQAQACFNARRQLVEGKISS